MAALSGTEAAGGEEEEELEDAPSVVVIAERLLELPVPPTRATAGFRGECTRIQSRWFRLSVLSLPPTEGKPLPKLQKDMITRLAPVAVSDGAKEEEEEEEEAAAAAPSKEVERARAPKSLRDLACKLNFSGGLVAKAPL